jgi:hypothetical protein
MQNLGAENSNCPGPHVQDLNPSPITTPDFFFDTPYKLLTVSAHRNYELPACQTEHLNTTIKLETRHQAVKSSPLPVVQCAELPVQQGNQVLISITIYDDHGPVETAEGQHASSLLNKEHDKRVNMGSHASMSPSSGVAKILV